MGKHSATPRPKRETETSEYVAMMRRIIVKYGDRIAADPIALVHVPELQKELADAVNRGVFEANQRGGYSQNEMAALAGVSRQAVQQRIGRGREVYAEIQRRRGAGALFRLADIRNRRAELARNAGVEDRTGSERERAMLRAV